MSNPDHEALVEAVAQRFCSGDVRVCPECRMQARAVLALIAKRLETVTPEMRDAIWNTRVSFEQAWADAIAASPLSPGRAEDKSGGGG